MHWKCKLFGHRWTKRIESKSMFFADTHFCGDCKQWSNKMPQIWFNKWGNGLFPDVWTNIKTFVKYNLIHPIDRWLHRNDELPF